MNYTELSRLVTATCPRSTSPLLAQLPSAAPCTASAHAASNSIIGSWTGRASFIPRIQWSDQRPKKNGTSLMMVVFVGHQLADNQKFIFFE